MEKIDVLHAFDKYIDSLESDIDSEIDLEVLREARRIILTCLQEEIADKAKQTVQKLNDKDLKNHFDRGFHEGYRQCVRDALNNAKIKVVK